MKMKHLLKKKKKTLFSLQVDFFNDAVSNTSVGGCTNLFPVIFAE